MLVAPKPAERPTCHPSAGSGYQSTSMPRSEELASDLDEAVSDCPLDVTFSPTKGPPLKVEEMVEACPVPAKTSPRTTFPPMAINEVEPRPEREASPLGPLPATFTPPIPLANRR